MANALHDKNGIAGLLAQNAAADTPLAISSVVLADSTPLHVAMVDGNGDQITSFGGGTQYTDGGTATTHPIGTGIIFNNGGTYNFVSAAQPLPITGTISASNPSVSATGSAIPADATMIGGSDGTNLQALQVDASKNLKVVLENSSIAVTGTFYQTTQPVSGTFWQSTQPVSLATLPALVAGSALIGKVGIDQTTVGTTNAVSIAQIGSSTLTIGQQLAAASIPVILPSATITTLTPPSNTGYALDASLTTLNTSVNTLLKPASTLTAVTTVSTVTNLSQMNGAALLMGNGTTGTGSQRVTVASDNSALPAWGHGATGSTTPSGATLSGATARQALPTAVSAGQLVGKNADIFGRQVVLPFGQRDIVLPMTQLTLTGTTTETSLITAVASTFLDLISLVVVNTSATATQVDFRDSTAGTIRLTLYVPAGDMRGVVFSTPFPQAAVNTAWTAKCVTSVSSVIITGSYITNK